MTPVPSLNPLCMPLLNKLWTDRDTGLFEMGCKGNCRSFIICAPSIVQSYLIASDLFQLFGIHAADYPLAEEVVVHFGAFCAWWIVIDVLHQPCLSPATPDTAEPAPSFFFFFKIYSKKDKNRKCMRCRDCMRLHLLHSKT